MQNEQIEQYIKGTQELLTKTAAVYSQNAPVLVEKLIALGLVKSSGRQAAINSLQSPEFVLGTLNSLLDSSLASQTTKQAVALGAPVKEATTVTTSLSKKKESDINFEKHFLKI
jgi:hypothetical protein